MAKKTKKEKNEFDWLWYREDYAELFGPINTRFKLRKYVSFRSLKGDKDRWHLYAGPDHVNYVKEFDGQLTADQVAKAANEWIYHQLSVWLATLHPRKEKERNESMDPAGRAEKS